MEGLSRRFGYTFGAAALAGGLTYSLFSFVEERGEAPEREVQACARALGSIATVGAPSATVPTGCEQFDFAYDSTIHIIHEQDGNEERTETITYYLPTPEQFIAVTPLEKPREIHEGVVSAYAALIAGLAAALTVSPHSRKYRRSQHNTDLSKVSDTGNIKPLTGASGKRKAS